MNSKKFSEAMSELDSKYVDEAITYKKKANKPVWIRWGAMAACLVIMVYAGKKLFPQKSSNNAPRLDLPMLTISENTSEAMGFEGYMAYDISELVSANPWSEDAAIATLPVYHNPITFHEQMISSGADFDKMRELLLEVAGRIGLDTNTLTITDDAPDEAARQEITQKLQSAGGTVPDGYFNPTRLTIETEGLKIEVDQFMTVTISFDPAVSLPSEYSFTHYSSYEELSDVAEYLKAEYKDLIGLDDPQINICGGDYNIYSQQGYRIEFFDANGSSTEQIVNYNFNRVAFYCDDEGKLFLARIYQPDLSEAVGDYPIITSEKASELLSNGIYITSVPYEMPGMEYVKKAELVYRTGKQEEYYMPYYRFYVELPETERDEEMKTYGAYYVPAVSGEYISNMPTRNGSFN